MSADGGDNNQPEVEKPVEEVAFVKKSLVTVNAIKYQPEYEHRTFVPQSEQSGVNVGGGGGGEQDKLSVPVSRPIIRNYAEFIEQGLEKRSFKGSTESLINAHFENVLRIDPEKIFMVCL